MIPEATRRRRWQAVTLGVMTLGYMGYYLCRSNFSVALPLIERELVGRGMEQAAATIEMGKIASFGVLAYAVGKLFGSSLADYLGGRRMFLVGMLGAIVFTVVFAFGGSLTVFTLAWVGNRLIQAVGWPGVVKVSSRWFSHASYSLALGLLSLSFLFGDAAGRAFMGWLFANGLDWRGVFLVAAATLLGVLALNALILRESPTRLGLPEPETSPDNVFGAEGSDPTPRSIRELLVPLLRSPAFWFVCLLSCGFTLLRETFNNWTPKYLVDGVRLDPAQAAGWSGLFPLFGGASVLLLGMLGGRLGRTGRAGVILGGLLLSGVALVVLGVADFGDTQWMPLMLVSLVAFLLIGPYSYLAGAISLDLGGKRGGATASGVIDGVGYLCGIASGVGVARFAVDYGWPGVFRALAGVAWLSSVAAALFLVDQRRLTRKGSATSKQPETLELAGEHP